MKQSKKKDGQKLKKRKIKNSGFLTEELKIL
jgi:hypothetical protein